MSVQTSAWMIGILGDQDTDKPRPDNQGAGQLIRGRPEGDPTKYPKPRFLPHLLDGDTKMMISLARECNNSCPRHSLRHCKLLSEKQGYGRHESR